MKQHVSRAFLRQYRQLFQQLAEDLGVDQARALLGNLLLRQFVPYSVLSQPIFSQEFELPAVAESLLARIQPIFDRHCFTLQQDAETALSPAILGVAHETLQARIARKSQGVFYTPIEVVHYICSQSLVYYLGTCLTPEQSSVSGNRSSSLLQLIEQRVVASDLVDEAQKLDDLLANIKVLDPALGTGIFLLEAVKMIAKMRLVLTPYLREQDQSQRTYSRLLAHALRYSIYGQEIDANSVKIARLQLWLCLLAESNSLSECTALEPVLKSHLKCGNFLLDPNESPNSFHIIIGNPPYIRIHKQEPALKATLKAHYQTAQGDYDTYVLFFEQGLQLLAQDGILAYITPDKFLVRAYGRSLKALLLQHSVLEFLDLARAKDIFAAATYPLITIVQKNQKTEQIRTKIAAHLSELRLADEVMISKSSLLSPYGFQTGSIEQIQLLDKIRAQAIDLAQVLQPGQIFCGTPRAKDYHHWQNFIVARQHLALPIDAPDVMRVLVCSHLRPYWINELKPVRVVGKLLEQPYFVNQGNPIPKRRWQEFGHVPKILIRGNDTRITAVLDRTHSVFVGIYGIKVAANIQDTALYLLGLLNSQLYQWIFATQYRSTRIAGNFFSINSLQLLSLPFKRLPQDRLLQVNHTVAQILALTEQPSYQEDKIARIQVCQLQQDIDHLIYQLFGLTAAEIRLVEQPQVS